jgi:hypothetical protein
MKPEVKIRNWSVVSDFSNPYQAPECLKLFLSGEVEDDNGKCIIRSSSVVSLNLLGRKVETRNTVYLLEGPPDEGWLSFLTSTGYDLSKLPE